MSVGRQGRKAALPPTGFRPRQSLRSEHDQLVVQFVAESTGKSRDFDFGQLPVDRALQHAFAQAFHARVRPGAGLRAESSAANAFRALLAFATYLGSLHHPPTSAARLTATHLDGWLLQRSSHRARLEADLKELKPSLKRIPGISREFAATVSAGDTFRREKRPTLSYSRSEFHRILSAARFDVRRAAARIRASRELLAQWRAGTLDRERDKQRWLQGKVLDHVDRHGDIPRCSGGTKPPMSWVTRLGRASSHMLALHLGTDDAAAFVVLLVGLTGQNASTIVSAPAAHHRPDGYVGDIASAIVELDKPRRGARRHMDVAWVELPEWLPARAAESQQGLGRDDLDSPFGVYTLLLDLAGSARDRMGTDRALAWWARHGGWGVGPGFRQSVDSAEIKRWSDGHNLTQDQDARDSSTEGTSRHLVVRLSRLRLTHAELHQKPIAHTEPTLANEYLLRNRGNIEDYQRVVADVLTEQVTKARTRAALRRLTEAEIDEARTDPAAVAARHGLDTTVLRRMLTGELDTVMAACTDNRAGPHTPGQPCRASFLLCLSCPCARALPHHLPLQVAVHDALQDREAEMTPLRWARRFGMPHTQLADLLDQAGSTAVADARVGLSADQRALVDRFLNRELDLP